MNTEYLYGAYGRKGDTVIQGAAQSTTAVAYVGTAPVNLVRGFAQAKLVNVPVKASNMSEAEQLLGRSANWAAFTLCEAMAAHFDNPLGNLGPVYLINVLDPKTHKKPVTEGPRHLTFVGGRCELQNDTIILDSFAIEKKVEDKDYSLAYDFERGVLVINSLDSENPLTGTIEVDYDEVEPSMVTSLDIIGKATDEGIYTGMGATALLYPRHNAMLSLLAAPGWSDEPSVYNAMVNTVQSINGHWDAFQLSDIPLEAGSIKAAIEWKKKNSYTSELSKVCWPQAKDAAGRIFHLSTLAAVEFMRADTAHEGIPMETCGNKAVSVIAQWFGEKSTNGGFDQSIGNQLAASGITTVVPWGGAWKLWGDHTAAYTHGEDMDPRAIFDISIRMLHYITNAFQERWMPEIDGPMSRQLVERVINEEQEKLDRWVSLGALLGSPRVQFINTENGTEQMMQGNFRWDLDVTPTPPFKSATAVVSYTSEGFSSLYGEGEQ